MNHITVYDNHVYAGFLQNLLRMNCTNFYGSHYNFKVLKTSVITLFTFLEEKTLFKSIIIAAGYSKLQGTYLSFCFMQMY